MRGAAPPVSPEMSGRARRLTYPGQPLERRINLFGGGTRCTGPADGHIRGELGGQIHKLAGATLTHLREDPAYRGAHGLVLSLLAFATLVRDGHPDRAPIIGVHPPRDETLPFQGSQNRGYAPRTRLEGGCKLRGGHGFLTDEMAQHKGLPLMRTTQLLGHDRPSVKKSDGQRIQSLLLETHDAASLTFPSMHLFILPHTMRN